MYRLIPMIFAAALFACGGSQKPAGGGDGNPCAGNPCGGNPCAANPCGGNPCGGNPCGAGGGAADASAGGDYSGWQSWPKVSSAVFVSKGHGKKPADIYVGGGHEDWYKNLAEGQTAPVGFQVVKVHYKDMTGGEIANIMVMTKMNPGYDAENGDWFYGVMDASGTNAMMAGKIEKCINCHSASDDTDFLGGLP